MRTQSYSSQSSHNLSDLELEDLYYTYRPVDWVQDHICTIQGSGIPKTLDAWQKDFLNDKDRDILMICHRQAGKSTVVAFKALHRAIFRDRQTILLVSPTQRQSSELFHKVRSLLKSTKYSDLLTIDNKTSIELKNGSRIISLPGMDWNIRGYSADMVIVDEAADVDDAVFDAISPMLLITKGSFILLSTPKGNHGRFYESYGSDIWKKYVVTVHDNPRMQTEEMKDQLEKELKRMGSRIFGQEYECVFLDSMDVGRIKRGWWQFYDVNDVPNLLKESSDRYVSWDPASKIKELNDYTAGTTWLRAGENHYVLELFHEKVVFPDLVRAVVSMDHRYNPVFNINEDKSSGIALNQELRERHPNIPVYEFNPGKMDKAQRLDIAAPYIESGKVFLPAHAVRDGDNVIMAPTEEAKKIMDNLAEFPEGEHDDITDCVSQYFVFTHNHSSEQNFYFLDL